MSDSNHSTDIGTIAYMSGVAKGREDERAKIVAWLRDDFWLTVIAAEIEAGEHLK